MRVEPLRREAISRLYSTSATLRAEKRATVIARTRGVIERILVEEGDRVREGRPLAELENDEQRIAVERDRTNARTLANEAERQADLHAKGLTSEDAHEQAQRDAEEARHSLALSELELERTIIRAPFDGTILTRLLDPGDTVADGTEVYELADLDPLLADINVPERHVARLEPGQAVRLTVDATEDVVDARIERIAPLVDPETGTVKVTVVVDRAAGLRPGSFVRVDIVTDTHQDALVAPRSALVAEGNRWHMFGVESTDRGDAARRVDVTLGFENGDRVEVAEQIGSDEPLRAGDPVVVSGAPALSDGSPLEIIGDDEPARRPATEPGERRPSGRRAP